MFSSLIRHRAMGLGLAMILSLTAAQTDAVCRNIVVSKNAQYMVLDPETLTVLQVGDLHWLGIHSGGVRAGSRHERALITSSYFLQINSEEPILERTPVELYLENMGEGLRSQGEIPVIVARDPPFEYFRRVEWADWIEENTVIREIYDRDQHYIAGYELLDTEFNVLQRWEPRVGFNLQSPSCVLGNSVYFAGWSGVHVFDDQGGTIYELEELQDEGLRLVTPHTKNCMALAFRDTPDENPMRGAVLVDIISGTLGPDFPVQKFSEYLLFDNGNLLLLQKREERFRMRSSGERIYSTPDTTNQFSLIDTTTGLVLLERELDTGSGLLSREMLCDAETPRALIKDDDAFYLIDPNTLEVVASKTVPTTWDGLYYVFE